MRSAALRREWPLLFSGVVTVLFLVVGKRWLSDLSSTSWFALMLTTLFAAIMSGKVTVIAR